MGLRVPTDPKSQLAGVLPRNLVQAQEEADTLESTQQAQPQRQAAQEEREFATDTLDEELLALGDFGDRDVTEFPEDELSELESFAQEDTGKSITDPVKELIKQKVFDKIDLNSLLSHRVAAGFGRSKKEELLILENRLGKANVRTNKDGEIEVDEGDGFKAIDPEGVESGDFTSDLVGGVVDAVLSTMAEIPAAAAGTAAGGPAGGFAASSAAAAGVSNTFGEAIVEELSGGLSDEDITFQNSLAQEGLLRGGFKVIGKGFSLAARRLENMLEGTQKGRIKQLAQIKKGGTEVVQESIGSKAVKQRQKEIVKGTQEFTEELEPFQNRERATNSIESMLEGIKEQLGKKVGNFTREALVKAKNQELKAANSANFVETFVKTMDENLIPFDKQARKFDFSDLATEGNEALVKDLEIVNKWFSEALENKGMKPESIIQRINSLERIWQKHMKTNDFGGRVHSKDSRIFSKLGSALRSDKNQFVKDMLPGNNEVGEAFAEFASKVDHIKGVQKFLNKGNNVKELIDNIVDNKNRNIIRGLKETLGESSEHWEMFKGAYFNKLLDDATSKTTGIFDASSMLKKLTGLTKELRRDLMPDDQFKKMVKLARQYEQISKSDLVNDPNAQRVLRELMGNAAGSVVNPLFYTAALTRTIMNVGRTNKKAADYLVDKGIDDLVSELSDSALKKSYIKAKNISKSILRNPKLAIKMKSRLPKGKVKEFHLITRAGQNLLLGLTPDGLVKDAFGGISDSFSGEDEGVRILSDIELDELVERESGSFEEQELEPIEL